MATLLHDAVMNPAEGNVFWSQGVAVGCQRGRKNGGRDGGQKVGQEDSWSPGRISNRLFFFLPHFIKGLKKGH